MRLGRSLLLPVALAVLSLAGRPAVGQGVTPPSAPPPGKSLVRPAPIDINSASRAQLKTLPWIGDAEADRIIAGRPYRSKAALVTEGILPEGVYQAIRHRIVAIQPGPPAGSAAPGAAI